MEERCRRRQTRRQATGVPSMPVSFRLGLPSKSCRLCHVWGHCFAAFGPAALTLGLCAPRPPSCAGVLVARKVPPPPPQVLQPCAHWVRARARCCMFGCSGQPARRQGAAAVAVTACLPCVAASCLGFWTLACARCCAAAGSGQGHPGGARHVQSDTQLLETNTPLSCCAATNGTSTTRRTTTATTRRPRRCRRVPLDPRRTPECGLACSAHASSWLTGPNNAVTLCTYLLV